MSSERAEATREIAAPPPAVFAVLRDPRGHVAIDSSGMLQAAEGEPVTAVGDTFLVHMDREALGDIRPRRPEDLPALAQVLLDQQPGSGYPFRDPLPVPVERFLHADDADAAWTAELDGRVVGHVCRVRAPRGPAAAATNAVCAREHDCTVDDLAWVSALFVAHAARGWGLGRRLLDTVVADIAAAGRYACLEVLPVHAAASALYASSGWTEVSRLRPAWLVEAAGESGPEIHVLIRR